tara:strand:+ start:7202 stop:8683 length:1482 start_codon:yes stop_codon:yes gene_type:complete
MLITATLLLAAVALGVSYAQRLPAELYVAQQSLGDRWYQIKQFDKHIGHMHHQVSRAADGWQFSSTVHLAPQGPGAAQRATRFAQQLTFADHPPYPLHSARYAQTIGSQVKSIDIQQNGTGYAAAFAHHDNRTATDQSVPLAWDFDLADHLALEVWLQQAVPLGEQLEASWLNLATLKLQQRAYTLTDQRLSGFTVMTTPVAQNTRDSDSAAEDFRSEFDGALQLLRMETPGGLQFIRSSEAQAQPTLLPASLGTATGSMRAIPIDQRLSDHTNIAELVLAVEVSGTTTHATLGLPQSLQLSAKQAGSSLPSSRQQRPHNLFDAYLSETLNFPVNHPAIRDLLTQYDANSADLDQTPGHTLAELIDFVHNQLDYVENAPAGSVLRALAVRQGECTDFADLFTTLARHMDLPARTVFGMAYRDGAEPGFMFHAWNEVYWSGAWHSVDPTWNQPQTDATHITLTDQQAAALQAANRRGEVQFRLLSSAYWHGASS